MRAFGSVSALLGVVLLVHARAAENNVDWPVYGGTSNEQHYSPLTQISAGNVDKLGLAWFHDLPPVLSAVAEPVEADGALFAAFGLGFVDALDAVTGRLLWSYDPETALIAGDKLRTAWATRGLAYWDHKVYVGTQDGRLVALNAGNGKPVWSVETTDKDDGRYIAGPPRVFDGKVIIGNGGADQAPIRGYVTAYDARTGLRLWRFHTVPGNPADGFENDAMKMAAQTWKGEWWKYGGGGTVWHSITYDAKYRRIYLGTGNGQPWNRRIRSQGLGDNLFLCSVVALDADTGKYVWHYQTVPGESWDFNSSMDIELAELKIGGVRRDVILHAPKNGFFYVLDRANGKLLSAEKIGKVTWAQAVDPATGRPIENPNIRYEEGEATIWPGSAGVHNWLAMSFNPTTGLVYIPTQDFPGVYTDRGIDAAGWTALPRGHMNTGVNTGAVPRGSGQDVGNWLVAWDPVARRSAWRIQVPGNAGVLTTGSGLVFQGNAHGRMVARAADTGAVLWDYDARVGIIAQPISFMRNGVQYVTVMGGFGGPQARSGVDRLAGENRLVWDYRQQKRRVLTFVLGGKAELPAGGPVQITIAANSGEQTDSVLAARGQPLFDAWCARCHGSGAVANGTAPDLRASSIPLNREAFAAVVRQGILVPRGMPRYDEFRIDDVEALRNYVRARAERICCDTGR